MTIKNRKELCAVIQKELIELRKRIKELESKVDYYEEFEAFIDTFDPRIVSDAHEHLSQVKKEAQP